MSATGLMQFLLCCEAFIYTQQRYKKKKTSIVFPPIFHKLKLKMYYFLWTQKNHFEHKLSKIHVSEHFFFAKMIHLTGAVYQVAD